MKAFKIFAILMVFTLTGCDLTLLPEDAVSPETYFKTETDLQLWTNQFYKLFDSSDNLSGQNADDMVDKSMGSVIEGTRLPSDGHNGTNEWNWSMLRNINFYLQNSSNCTNEKVRSEYDGVAYFFRAYCYYQKLIRYGDLPWYDQVLNSTDDELLAKSREDRGVIMDHILADLDLAIAQLPEAKNISRVTKWTALAFKSRAALYEGTWRQYRNLPNAEKYLTQAAEAAKEFIDNSGYGIYSIGDQPYRDLFNGDQAKEEEVVLARIYNFAGLNLSHSVQFNIKNSAQGFTKRFMNHYLMSNGTRFTEKENYNTMFYTEEVKDRDPRLAQTVLCPGYIPVDEKSVVPNDLTSMTGYEPIKFVASAAHSGASKGTSDWALFRTAEVYLNYAEAKAELGTLTKADLEISIDKIRARVKMPKLSEAAADPSAIAIDPFLAACYPNVTQNSMTGAILEIRRERTIELVMEGFRQWDMFRWKEGAQMINKSNPYYGIYFSNIGLFDMDGDGKNDLEIYSTTQQSKPSDGLTVLKTGSNLTLSEGDHGYIVAYPSVTYEWNEGRDYLWPVPADQRVLTGGALSQNPGWKDSTNFN